jgi:hypothetical protein
VLLSEGALASQVLLHMPPLQRPPQRHQLVRWNRRVRRRPDDLADRFQDRAPMIDQGAVQIEEHHIHHRRIISWCLSLTPEGRYRDLRDGCPGRWARGYRTRERGSQVRGVRGAVAEGVDGPPEVLFARVRDARRAGAVAGGGGVLSPDPEGGGDTTLVHRGPSAAARRWAAKNRQSRRSHRRRARSRFRALIHPSALSE